MLKWILSRYAGGFSFDVLSLLFADLIVRRRRIGFTGRTHTLPSSPLSGRRES